MGREDLAERLQVASRMVRNCASDHGPRDEDAEAALANLLEEASNCILTQEREIGAALTRNVILVNELDERAREERQRRNRNRSLASKLLAENEIT